jgi:hypothetical protein
MDTTTRVYECDGCGQNFHDDAVVISSGHAENQMIRCFNAHPCHYCGGQMDYREHSGLTPGAGMLWCGCREGE